MKLVLGTGVKVSVNISEPNGRNLLEITKAVSKSGKYWGLSIANLTLPDTNKYKLGLARTCN